jgi:peptide/nickel transport system permease protein
MPVLIAGRVLHGVLLLFAVVILDFFLLHLAPGSIADTLASASGGATPAILAQIKQEYGLNKPLYIQLYLYLAQILHGNLGESYFYNQPVLTLIGQRLPATLLLVVSAQCWSIFLGTLMGVIAATKPRGLRSTVVAVLSMIGYATPAFWLGIMLLILFAWLVPIFPTSGMMSIDSIGAPVLTQAADILHHLVLPSFTLGFVYLAQYSRLARASMIEALQQDYVRTARAKGVAEYRVVFKHALRNALLPVVTVGGLQFSQIVAGAVLVDTVFNWPGMGLLAYNAVLRRDYTLVLGILAIAAIVVVVMNLLTDLACYWLDPRIR